MQQGLEEIKESHMAILVSVEELHVVDSLKVDVQIREVELFAGEQDALQLVLRHLAGVWPVLVTACIVE